MSADVYAYVDAAVEESVLELAKLTVNYPEKDLPLAAVFYAIRQTVEDPMLAVMADQAMRWAVYYGKASNQDDLYAEVERITYAATVDCSQLDCECQCHLGRNPAFKDCEKCDDTLREHLESVMYDWRGQWRCSSAKGLLELSLKAHFPGAAA